MSQFFKLKKGWEVWLIFVTFYFLASCSSFMKRQGNGEDGENQSGMGYYQRDERGASDPIGFAIQPKRKILILKFWNDTPIRQDNLGEVAADETSILLRDSDRILLSSEAAPTLSTQDYIQGDKIRVSQLIQEGRKYGVSLVLIGRISRITLRQSGEEIGLLRRKYTYAGAELEIKLFDVQAGREILAAFKMGEISESALAALQTTGLEDPEFRAELSSAAVRKASSLFISDILKALDKTVWQGHVAKVEGKNIFINAGRASGVHSGDILRVFTMGEDIYDPVTGAYLGRSPGKLKGTLEVVDFVGTDGGVTHLHTGGNVQEGDLVQLY